MREEFDVRMTASALYDYNMYQTYSSVAGIVATVFGALLLIVYAATRQPAFAFGGVVVILYSPFALYFNAKKQVKLNPTFRNSIHYTLDDEGVTVSQGDEELTVAWENMLKARSTEQSIFLYTSKNSAWIFPKKDLGEKKYDIIELISTHMPPSKVNIKQ